MRIVVAPDSFKDALPAAAACEAIAAGLLRRYPAADIVLKPLADGGEGAGAVLAEHLRLSPVAVTVADPLLRPVRTSFDVAADGQVAVIEMARAAGLERLTLAERDPEATSTLGVGQMIAHAAARGARRIVLAIGGSATNDGGIGLAQALGWRFLDANGAALPPVGGVLTRIARIEAPPADLGVSLEVMCDVTNPLYGPAGAAWVYGRQKGGDDAALARLDAGLRNLAAVSGRGDLADAPGAGAAGGLGFGAMAFLGGVLRGGADMVMDLAGLDEALAGADLVVTGEGHLDGQTAHGKLIFALCRRAAAAGVPVIALCGKVSADADQLRAIGLTAAHDINRDWAAASLDHKLARTAQALRQTAAALP